MSEPIEVKNFSLYADDLVTSKWEFFTQEKVLEHAGKWAVVGTSYDQFAKAYCVKVEQHNDYINTILGEEHDND